MSLPVQPLLSLVKNNANGLKLLLKNYIDFTVDNQFDQLKNSIVQMIATGQIGPQSNDSALASTQTTFPSGQSIADPEDFPNLHHSNDQLTITIDQITLPSPVSTITPSTQIKQECVDYCIDAPNDKLNNVGIEVNDEQNGQVPIDEVKEEYDNDDDDDEDEGEYMSYDECEDCLKGICQLNQSHLVCENDNTENDTPNVTDNDDLENIVISSSVQGRDSQDEFVDEAFDDDVENQLLPTSQQHNDHFTASIVSSTIYDSNDQLTTDQITLPPTNQLQTSTKQSNNNLTNPNETSPPNGQSQVKGQCPIETKQVNHKTQIDEPVNEQSMPSTSGLRSSGRKRIPKKMFGDDQSNEEVKRDKRKSTIQSSKAVKKIKHQDVDEIQQEDYTKLQIVTLEINCTEPDCETILKSLEMWKDHLSNFHGQMPYKLLRDNVRHNNRQTGYPCTECNVVCKSPKVIFKHWKYYHQPGKFECSVCAFGANFRCEVFNHMHNKHRPRKFRCTYEECNKAFISKRALEQHKPTHRHQRPFACIWAKCQVTFRQHKTAIQHVRVQHFRLPQTVKEQHELNIIEERDPKVYVKLSGD